MEQFAVEPVGEPPPRHFHVRVVPQAVAPLSLLTVPAEQTPAVEEHTPLTVVTQAALALEQFAVEPAGEPPPRQFQVRVVPQAVALLSLLFVPAEQTPAVDEHAPFTVVGQAALALEQLAFEPLPEPLQVHVRVVPQAEA
ncbi:hypothetical protein LBX01_08465 [Altererythrobacter sp. N1]|nr:hypothetical protein LBX01_08465 [Altererythrobacter sp. N1]